MAVDPMTIDAMYRKYMYGRLADDEEENQTRTSYQSALDDLQKNRRSSVRDLGVNMADRGLTHSGINLQANLDTNAGYDTQQSRLGTDMTSNLARIAKKRLVDDSNYNMQRGLMF